jgi:hypothetical protein
MIMRLQLRASRGKVPSGPSPETPETPENSDSKLINGRSAGIIFASFLIAVAAGALTYFMAGKSGASLAGAILAGGATFGGAIRLLNSIIA